VTADLARLGLLRWLSLPPVRRYKILVCRGPECGDRRGSRVVYEAFRQALEAGGLAEGTELGWQSCFGRCSQGPNALVKEIQPGEQDFAFASVPGPRGVTALYNRLDPQKAKRVVAEHLESGVIVRELIERPAPLATAEPSGKPPPGDR
jgi:(2Fe-2S) ferredoxin